MSNSQGLHNIWDFFELFVHFLGRYEVQIQLFATLLIYLIAWLIAKLIFRLDARLLRRHLVRRFPKRYWGISRRIIRAIERIIYPVLSLLGLYSISTLLKTRGFLHGLVDEFIILSTVFLIYRIFMSVIYGIFPERYVKRYHYRLLVPLFISFAVGHLFNAIMPLDKILDLPVFSLATPTNDNPNASYTLRTRALLLASLGLYLWVDGTSALQNLLRSLLTRRSKLDAGSVEASLTIGRYIALIVAIAVVLRSLGINTTTVGFITGGLSVGIGIGLQGIVSNFVSGLILLFEQSIRPGDMIEVEGEKAIVQRLTIRAAEVRTFSGVEIVIPNEKLINSNVRTLSKSDKLVRLDINVGVAYDTDLRKAQDILLNVARAHPDVLRDPEPIVWVLSFGDSAINLSLKAWVGDLKLLTSSDLHLAVWEAFQEEDIQIPFPQQDLHLKTDQDTFRPRNPEANLALGAEPSA